MSSIKNINTKFSLIDRKIVLGTNNGINVNAGSLYVEPNNNRVGINKLTPTSTLDISGSFKYTSLVDYSGATSTTDTQVLENNNNNILYSYIQDSFTGNNMFSREVITNLSSTAFPNVGGGRPFQFPCLAPNGNIYVAPANNSNQILIINTNTDTFTIKTSNISLRSGGAVCAHNGKIYMPPFFNSDFRIRVIDTVSGDFEYFLSCNPMGFYGGCLAPNGKIYFVPNDFSIPSSPKIMVVNPINDNITYIDVSGINYDVSGTGTGGIGNANGDDVWYGGALAPNGKIYCVPARGTSILVIDTNNDTAQCDISGLSGWPVTGTGGSQVNKYSGAVLAPNGRIYGLPGCINAYPNPIEIDPSSNTYTILSTSFGPINSRRCIGGTLAPNGNIYSFTDNAGLIGVINTNTTPVTVGTISFSLRTNGSCLGPNGKIYILPNASGGASTIKVMKTGIPTLPEWMLAPEFNKY